MQKSELEKEADRLLGLNSGRRGRKIANEYPVLTERQLATRQWKEVPLGDRDVSMFGEAGLHVLTAR